MLEYSLIKQHQPRFNIRLKDDKSYPFLAVTLDDEWPRAMVMRGAKRKGVRYFGPYGHAYAIRETLDLLLRTFPIRTCSDNKFARHERLGRPCLLFHIEKCCGPVRRRDRQARLRRVWSASWSSSSTATPTRSCDRLEAEMRAAGRRARVRAGGPAARPAHRGAQGHREAADGGRQATRTSTSSASPSDELEAAVQVFFVRRGRVVGRKGFVRRQGRGPHAGRARSTASLEGLYADAPPLGVPKQVLVPVRAADDPTCTRSGSTTQRGSKVDHPGAPAGRQARAARDGHPQRHRGVHPPPAPPGGRPQQPGPGAQRAAGGARPARGPAAHRVLRHEPHPGHRLRGLDGGAGGRPAQASASTGASRSRAAGQRRLRRHGGGAHPPAHRLPRRPREARRRPSAASFSYPPQLLLVDGGKGQLAVAVRVLDELGLDEEIPVASLAKRFEEVYGRAAPSRCACRVSPRRCTCCSASATRPTGSPSRSTASCAASA